MQFLQCIIELMLNYPPTLYRCNICARRTEMHNNDPNHYRDPKEGLLTPSIMVLYYISLLVFSHCGDLLYADFLKPYSIHCFGGQTFFVFQYPNALQDSLIPSIPFHFLSLQFLLCCKIPVVSPCKYTLQPSSNFLWKTTHRIWVPMCSTTFIYLLT